MTEVTIYVLRETPDNKCMQCRYTIKEFVRRGVSEADLNIVEVAAEDTAFLKEQGFQGFPVVVPDNDFSKGWSNFRTDRIKELAEEMLEQRVAA